MSALTREHAIVIERERTQELVQLCSTNEVSEACCSTLRRDLTCKEARLRKSTPSLDRFMAKITVTDAGYKSPCWLWPVRANSYGTFHLSNPTHAIRAHRWAYEQFIGPVPDGLVIDHLCRNPSCVNPAHLEAVTQKVNLLRGNTLQAQNTAKTHCIHGHLLDGNNLYKRPNGKRVCRICRLQSQRIRRYKRQGVA